MTEPLGGTRGTQRTVQHLGGAALTIGDRIPATRRRWVRPVPAPPARLQGALRKRGPMSVVVEPAVQIRVVDDPA